MLITRLVFLILITATVLSCKTENNTKNTFGKTYLSIGGQTMGTYYRVKYQGDEDLTPDMDSLLLDINMALSTYIPESEISLFNLSKSGAVIGEGYFKDNLDISRTFFELSGGFYDPTVMPIVNYWGFGYDGKTDPTYEDTMKVKTLLMYVGLEKINSFEKEDSIELIKTNPQLELDFSSVAKGYGVDILAEYLEKQGINNYMVDIGGEMRLSGKNARGQNWSIGINTPLEGSPVNEAMQYIGVTDKAIATSGNYRNFYEKDGRKISHTINPKTGYPERSILLSATVLADDCAHADAWSTTCMVLGLDRSVNLLGKFPGVHACLIYNDNDELAIKYVNEFEKYLLDK